MEDQVFEPSVLVFATSTQVKLELTFTQLSDITPEVAKVHVLARLL